MNCDEFRNQLDALVDGELTTCERSAMDAHSEACADCRVELESMRELQRQTASLSRQVEPPSDLWLEISERIESRKLVVAPFGSSIRRFAAAAAAAAVIIAAVLVAYMVGRQHSTPMVVEMTPTPNVMAARLDATSMAAVESDFRQARSELMAILDQRRDSLSPETLEVVDSNLRLIDEAIEQISDALGDDPDNPQLSHRLAFAYRQQIQLLRRATNLPSEI
jgi:hypothetical protein